jgi:pimeloyl-ACP methyl ester carboxylesterase
MAASPSLAVSGDMMLARPGRSYARRLVRTEAGPIAYVQIGEGCRNVVLVHGVLTAADDMVLALADHLPGARIIAFDRPGYGRSPRRTALDAGVLSQARRLNQALEALEVGSTVLVGHSYGAAVVLAMAMAAPQRVHGVVSLAPLVVPQARLEHLLFGPRGLPVLGGWLSGWSHGGLDQALLPILWRAMFLPQAVPASFAASFPFALAGEAGATGRVGEDSVAAGPDLLTLLMLAPTLAPPLHVLGGSADLVVNNRLHGQTLAALAPRGRFTLLPGVGHMIHHAAPQAVAAAIQALPSA